MNARTLLSLGLLTMAPSFLAAQTPPEPPVPAIAPAPSTPIAARAPRVPNAPRPAVAVAVEPSVPAPEAAPQPAVAPKPATAPVAPVAPAMAIAPPKPLGQMLNVRIDVTLSDSKGPAKVLTLTVADGENGMNRTTSSISSGTNRGDFSFNADAAPLVIGNKIRLRLTADATVPIDVDNPAANRANQLGLRQSQTVILNDGDSVEIARAADPVSDRAFVLSVKVKIQR